MRSLGAMWDMPTARPTTRIRVLCVDDNDLLRRALVTALRRVAWIDVVGENDSADSLDALARELRPEVILLDIDMPGRDPFAAMSELQASGSDTRVLVFTGHARPEFADRAVACGAWGYLSKSAGIEEVASAIRDVHAGTFVFDHDTRA